MLRSRWMRRPRRNSSHQAKDAYRFALKAISIDPEQRTARIEPGLTWGAVAHALQPYGLALTSGDVATVGVGGLMLDDGIGWMVRKYGLTIDHLRAVELVTAGGEMLLAAQTESGRHYGPTPMGCT